MTKAIAISLLIVGAFFLWSGLGGMTEIAHFYPPSVHLMKTPELYALIARDQELASRLHEEEVRAENQLSRVAASNTRATMYQALSGGFQILAGIVLLWIQKPRLEPLLALMEPHDEIM